MPAGGRSQGARRWVRSDWMAIERERGISVSSAVMSFEHEGLAFNLLDTPGHQDFSEDTYRTLTAVDSAVMVLDALPMAPRGHRGADPQALRGLSAARCADHHYRGAATLWDLLDEIGQLLALGVIPAS